MTEPDTSAITLELLAKARCVLASRGEVDVVLAAAAIVDAAEAGSFVARQTDIDAVEQAVAELGVK